MSSIKEKMEYFISTNRFEKELYVATSNSLKETPSTKNLYLIADYSHNRDNLILIIIRILHRLKSKQKKKWKRIQKTLILIEFLLYNGSIDFVAIMVVQYIKLVEGYCNYEYFYKYEEIGEKIRTTANSIIKISKNKNNLMNKRKECKEVRKKVLKNLNFSINLSDLPKNEDEFFKEIPQDVPTPHLKEGLDNKNLNQSDQNNNNYESKIKNLFNEIEDKFNKESKQEDKDIDIL